MKPVDDAEVWSLVCFYVAKPWRGKGLQHRLLAAALDHARDHGVRHRRVLPRGQAGAQSRRLPSWPAGWQLVELNPAHVTEQRRVQGRRRVKTDAIDLEAITELVLAGRGTPVTARAVVLGELAAWVGHRSRRVESRTALKNQLLGQLDRCFPGLTLALPDVLGTKVGRLVAEHFTDPARLASLGQTRFIRFAATRGLIVKGPVAARLVAAAREVLPTRDAAVARQMVDKDLQMLRVLDQQVSDAEDELGALLPHTPFEVLTTVPGWATIRVSAYGAAVGDPSRWPGPPQIYRAAGLSPMQYESAGKRRDGAISREGSVELRRALIGLGVGLWLNDPAAKTYATALRAAARRAASSPALWPTGPTGSPTPWSATKPATTPPGGGRRPDKARASNTFPPARDRVQAGR